MEQHAPDGQSRSFSVASGVATNNDTSSTFPAHAASFVATWEPEIVRTARFNAARLVLSSTDTRTMAQELAQAARIRVAMLRDTTVPKSYVRAVIRNAMIRLVRNERASFGQLSQQRIPLPDDLPTAAGEGSVARRDDVAA